MIVFSLSLKEYKYGYDFPPRAFADLLCFLFSLVCLPNHLRVASSSTSSFSCQPDQAHALLRFIHPFSITCCYCPQIYPFVDSFSTVDCDCRNASCPKVASRREDADCCSWDGVTCDNSTGNVIGLDLTCAGLRGFIHSGSPLFSLHRLRSLSLAGNDLLGSAVPPEIGVFTRLEYLDLSYSNISGILPMEISQLSKLISLNISCNFHGLEMQDHTMRMLVSNLTQLEELNLGSVDMYMVNPTSFMNLSSSLISLKLSFCWMGGKFPGIIFGLPNLQVIDISGNSDLIGTLPKSKWSPSLDYLSLGGCYFTGTVPNSIGNLSRLTHLDLSGNYLTGAVPNSIGILSRLTHLDLSYNNFNGGLNLGILSTLENLHFLDLSRTPVSGDDANHGISLLKLQELKMRGCNLSKFPSFLSRSKELRLLDLSWNEIKEIPGWLWSIGIDTLELLSLDGNTINGSIPQSICQLTSLSFLDLSGNNLIGLIPQCLGNLTKLQELSLSYNSLSGLLPPSLANFTSLWRLDVSNNILEGPLPSIANCTSLGRLDVSNNILEGPLPMLPTSIYDFQVWKNRFSGSIPPSLCRLTSLPQLDLSQNNFTEVIPLCLGNLTELQELDLSSNSLSGPLPPFLANLTSLWRLDVSYNILEGSLPMLPAFIRDFQVRNNRFGGSIPSSMCHLTSLPELDLSQNCLTGVIPRCLGNLTSLSSLNLSTNSLSGYLPPSLANCTSLVILDVSNNNINGAPPTWLPASSVSNIDLRANNFVGQWPPDIFLRSAFLAVIDLSDNKFEGPLPIPSKSMALYLVFNNQFYGKISSVMCNATNLYVLDLSNNSLTGALPDCLKNVTRDLFYLNLRANEFQGQISEIFHEDSKLTSLDLSENQFEGPLPRSLSHCKQLEVLDVANNKIDDSFPNWLGGLPLKVISLRSNRFRGHVNIARGTHPFTMSRIMDLSRNSFDGNLQYEFISEMFNMMRGDNYDFGNQYLYSNSVGEYYSVMIDLKGIEMEMVKINVQFAMLDLSSNQFHGEIQKSIGLLKSLKGLNFSHNRFSGTIPPSVGNLTDLESLDLSSNHLMGEITKELVKLTSLGFLDLSWNNLTGPIPSGGHFNTFSSSSFQGNPRLCGIPLTRSCGQGNKKAQPPSEGKDDEKKEGGRWMVWEYVALGFGTGMGMGISLGYMVLEMGRPLWLLRVVIRLEANYRKMSKRKKGDQRRNGRR